MSSSSGGDLRADKSPAPSKIKTQKSSLRGPDADFELVVNKKNLRKLNNAKSNPTSPSLQQIINNTPHLNTSKSVFNYDNSLSSNNMPVDMVIDDSTVTDNINEPCNLNHSVSQINSTSTSISNNLDSTRPNAVKYSLQHNHIMFPSNFNGPIIILVECIDLNKSVGSWHPVKAAKFFSSNFTGITNIKPAGFKKIKITFDSIVNGNQCLSSTTLTDYGFSACIPSNLIFSFGIIKLDNDILESDFWEGVSSPFPIESFRRISIKKNDIVTPTRIVELKFFTPKLPQHISIFNMLFEVEPSVRSPVQCNRCLRFGHTQKFCRSDSRCSHCGGTKHSIAECSTIQATDPSCFYCKLPHLATDRICREWLVQKDIKKIMANENISYQDALVLKKNNCYTSAFKFTDIVNRQPPVSNLRTSSSPLCVEDFPDLNDKHHFFNSKKSKPKVRSPTSSKIDLSPSFLPSYSSPNGGCLKQSIGQEQVSRNKINDFSWIHTLSNILSESLLNSHTLSAPFSPSALQSLIESSLHSLLIVPSQDDN